MKRVLLLAAALVSSLALASLGTPEIGVVFGLGSALCACGAATSRNGKDGLYSPVTVCESGLTTGTTATRRKKSLKTQTSISRNDRKALLTLSSTA
jgi:hypothetical protein